MGDVVQLSEARARRPWAQGEGRGAVGAPAQRAPHVEPVEHGSGWYHGEAIRAARKEPEPR